MACLVPVFWTADRTAQLSALLARGLTLAKAAEKMEVSRGAAAAAVKRYRLARPAAARRLVKSRAARQQYKDRFKAGGGRFWQDRRVRERALACRRWQGVYSPILCDLLDLLEREGPQNASRVCAALRLRRRTARDRLQKLQRLGLVVPGEKLHRDGPRYALTEKARRPLSDPRRLMHDGAPGQGGRGPGIRVCRVSTLERR